MTLLKTARTFKNLLDYSLRGDVNAQYLVSYTFDVQYIFDFLGQKTLSRENLISIQSHVG